MTNTTESRVTPHEAAKHAVALEKLSSLQRPASVYARALLDAASFLRAVEHAAPAASAPEPVATVISEWHETSLVRNENREVIPAGTKLYATPPAPVAANAVDAMRKALEFYANERNWIDTPPWEGDPEMITPKAIPVLPEEGRPCDCGDTARRALAATPPSPTPVADNPAGETSVKAASVKPLKWVRDENVPAEYANTRAETPFGTYMVNQRDGEWFLFCLDKPRIKCASEEDAYAKGFKDYERRVRACLEPGQGSSVRYRNWRGEIAARTIIPLRIWHGSTDWHPEPQLLLRAWDVEKQAERDFALADFLPPPPATEEGR